MKYFCFLIMFLLFIKNTEAQKQPGSTWGAGLVALLDETEYNGQIKYDLTINTVQLNQGDKTLSFGASKVEYFEFFDVNEKILRQFYSLPFTATTSNYESLIFFELLTEGKITLLNREELIERVVSRPMTFGYYPGGTMIERTLQDNFFILEENGKVRVFDPAQENIFDVFFPYTNQMLDFAAKNRVSSRRKHDLILLINHYNLVVQGK